MGRGLGLPPGVERRGDGVYRIRLSYTKPDGTHTRPSFTVRGTVADVWREWHRLDAERQTILDRGVTVTEWIDRWLDMRRRNVSPTTFDTDYYRTLAFKTQYGAWRITDVTPADIDQFYTTLHDDGKSVGTINGIHSTLRKLFNDAVRKHVTDTNPVVGADVPTRRPQPKLVWTPDTVATFLHGAEGHRMYPLFHLALHTGMRREELMGIQWGDIDDDTLLIQRRVVTTSTGVQTLPATKNGTTIRTVILDPDTVTVLEQQRRRQTEQHFRLGQRITDATRIVTKDDGTPYGPRHVASEWTALVNRLGITPVIPISHARHTWATVALASGEEVKVVAERLGHSTTMTLNVYAQTTTASKRRAASVMSNAIRHLG